MGLLIAEPRVLSRVVAGLFPPPPQPTWCIDASVGVGDRPVEAGELARGGDRDDRASLAALCLQAAPGAVQALLGLPGERDHVGGLAVLATLERLALGRRPAVVPGGLDEQASRVAVAHLGDVPAVLLSPEEYSDGVNPR